MAEANAPPRRFGDFEIVEQLGRGGFGTVYKARDATLGNRIIALKVLNADLADDPDWVRRFQREASIAANLDHPAIPVIYRFGEVEGRHYIAMRFVPGQSLAALSRTVGPMDIGQIVTMLTPVAEALDFAHAHGVVHGDVKPGNILVDPDGQVSLTDFGLARPVAGSGASVTNTLANLAGTLQYLSPEQFQNGSPGPSSDRYALGVAVFELLTRSYPFDAANPVALGLMVVATPPPPVQSMRPDVSTRSSRAVAKMLAKSPGDRFVTSVAFVRELAGGSRRGLARSSGIAPQAANANGSNRLGAPIPAPRSASRRAMALGLTGAAGVGVLAVLLTRGSSQSRATTQAAAPTSPMPTRAASRPMPSPTVIRGATKMATIELETGGIITIGLFGGYDSASDAPNTVRNFETKANQGFYNGLKFHRVEDWVVQGGDPAGNGTGGSVMAREYNDRGFRAGAVGVARGSDPARNNDSQFFIVKRDSPHLNSQYTNFGQVADGFDHLVRIFPGDKIKRIYVR